MLFGGTELARRIERAERDLIAEGTAALASATGVEGLVLPLAGGVAAFSGPDSPLTKVAGLGFDGAPGDAELEAVERELGRRGAAVQVELATLAEGGLAERLTARGYALIGFENVLVRPLERLPEEHPGVAVAASRPEELETWLDVLVEAFAAPDAQGLATHESFPREATRRILRGMTSAPGFVRYLARRADEPAGGASLRLAQGLAQLCGAGTLPRHRRRGVQGALLARCLADAARAGCDLAVVTTLPGSKSHENVQRAGFELVYARAILRRAAP
ncbi:MAG TPA: GNAT family N-acetyltransferase [Planctomycetota bacterium]